MGHIKNNILDIVYPRHCPFCKEIIPYGKAPVCDRCMKKLPVVKPPYCMKCGKTVRSDEVEYCSDCAGTDKSFERGFPLFVYEEPVKTALYDFKYDNQRAYAGIFAGWICAKYGGNMEKLDIEGIIPVPLHEHKLRKRGYNQAALLAFELSKQLKIPCYETYLERVEDTNPQKELNDKERMKNLKKAFKIGQNKIKLKRVLLVDDIYTTGATIEACTDALKLAGVEKVWYTSVAVGQGYAG